MREISLDATTWGDRDDFYRELLPALGAPPWHGRNLDALNESLRGDDINKVKLLRIPVQSGQGFRFDPGHRSDLIAATIPT